MKRIVKKLTIIINSAALYHLSFYGFPQLIFFWLVPLFHLKKKNCLSFLDGFLWAIVFYTIHFFFIIKILYSQSSHLFGYILFGYFLCYISFLSGIIFVGIQKFKHCYILIFAHFLFIHYFLFLPLGLNLGYPFLFPLIPLISTGYLSAPLIIINKWVLLFCIILFQWSLFFKKRAALFFLFPFFLYFFIEKEPLKVTYFDSIQFIPLSDNLNHEEKLYQLIKICQKQREKKLFVTPESYLRQTVTLQGKTFSILKDNALNNSQTLLMSGNCRKNTNIYNTAFLLRKSRITEYYFKKTLVPFFEYTPYQSKTFLKIGTFLFKKNQEYSAGSDFSPILKIEPLGLCMPIICSELFWSYRQKNNADWYICLANDSYCTNFYKRVMLLNAQFTALIERKKILYCSSYSAYFINKDGMIIKNLS